MYWLMTANEAKHQRLRTGARCCSGQLAMLSPFYLVNCMLNIFYGVILFQIYIYITHMALLNAFDSSPPAAVCVMLPVLRRLGRTPGRCLIYSHVKKVSLLVKLGRGVLASNCAGGIKKRRRRQWRWWPWQLPGGLWCKLP